MPERGWTRDLLISKQAALTAAPGPPYDNARGKYVKLFLSLITSGKKLLRQRELCEADYLWQRPREIHGLRQYNRLTT